MVCTNQLPRRNEGQVLSCGLRIELHDSDSKGMARSPHFTAESTAMGGTRSSPRSSRQQEVEPNSNPARMVPEPEFLNGFYLPGPTTFTLPSLSSCTATCLPGSTMSLAKKPNATGEQSVATAEGEERELDACHVACFAFVGSEILSIF